jgi:hypothetical protein
MDKTILNLLFNYNGTITYREFRAGISILFMLMGTYLIQFFDSVLTNFIVVKIGGYEWFALSETYGQIVSSFIPNFVPAWFIVSYSSFVLTMKRVRMLNNNRTVTVILGIVNYLFFASFVALITLGISMPGMQLNELYMSIIKPVFYLVIAFLVFGLANLIYLCARRESEYSYFPCQKGRLDVLTYSVKIGNLIGITIILNIIISVILVLSDVSLSSKNVQYILLLYSLIIFFFYIRYSICRLKDANISILWLVSILIIYFIMLGLKIWTNVHFMGNLTLCYNTLFAVATSFFIALQYILFLLPTKNNNTARADIYPCVSYHDE